MDDLSDLKKIILPFDVEDVSPVCHECVRRQLKKYENYVDNAGNAAAGKFLVPCKGIKKNPIDPALRSVLTDEQLEEVEAINDVVKFAEKYLTLPDGSPWIARDYQRPILQCSARRKVLRISRRCLTGETPVLMADGTWKRLDEIKAGDYVVSRHSRKNLHIKRKVLNFFDNGQQTVYKITLSNGLSIKATSNHPFFTRHSNPYSFQTIEEGLQEGSFISVFDSKEKIFSFSEIENISYAGEEATYCIEVEQDHNFIANGILTKNSGKTDSNAIAICYRMFTESNLKIVVAAPQKTHVEEIFNRVKSFIRLNPDLNSSITRSVSAPHHEIRLKNGSRMRGFAVGTRGKSEGVSIRGQDADLLVVDELDFVDQEALISAILPLLQTNPNTEIVGFSTPTGAKTPFYYMCEENPHYKEFHYTYKVLPWWEQVEKERNNYTQDQWTREYLADWTASETNVYKNAYIDKATSNYVYQSYSALPTWRYCIGTDWNEKFGTEIAVLGFNTLTGMFQVVETLRVERSEFTQLLGVTKLMDMNRKWRPEFIYIDAGGGGSTNAELIRKMAYEERRKGGELVTARLLDRLKKYDSGSSIEVKDPIANTTNRVPAKPFMVNASIRLFEQERIKISSSDTTLLKQLRNYTIERTTPAGVNVYGMTDDKIGDHRLDALNLAIVAFHLEFDDLYKTNPAVVSCGAALDPRTLDRDELGKVTNSNEKRLEVMERRLDGDVIPKTDIEKQVFRQQPGKLRDPLGGVKTNRLGWDTDREQEELAKFIQRRRSRGLRNPDKPTRSKF